MKSIKKAFDQQGFVTIPYPEHLRRSVVCLADAWREWCSLDIQTKEKTFPYTQGTGYEYQCTPGPTRDIKEIFHYTGEAHSRLLRDSHGMHSKWAINLIASSAQVLDELFPEIVKYNRQMEKEFRIPGLVEEVEASKNSIFIRAIHYFGGRSADYVIAAHHVDKSGQTEHLYEDIHGVEYLDQKRNWQSLTTEKGIMIAFPSMQMQLRSKGKMKALCHRVIANEDSAERGRFAIVAFTKLAKTPEYDKKRAGRLQDLPAGFNYDMPHEEFSKYFA